MPSEAAISCAELSLPGQLSCLAVAVAGGHPHPASTPPIAQHTFSATPTPGLLTHAALVPNRCCRHPGLGPRDPKGTALLRLASGDDEGRVAVWNVSTGAAIAALEDPVSAAFLGQQRRVTADAPKPGVQGLAWVTAAPTLLAILAAPGYLVLWDFKANSIIWRKDLGAAELFTSIQVRLGNEVR